MPKLTEKQENKLLNETEKFIAKLEKRSENPLKRREVKLPPSSSVVSDESLKTALSEAQYLYRKDLQERIVAYQRERFGEIPSEIVTEPYAALMFDDLVRQGIITINARTIGQTRKHYDHALLVRLIDTVVELLEMKVGDREYSQDAVFYVAKAFDISARSTKTARGIINIEQAIRSTLIEHAAVVKSVKFDSGVAKQKLYRDFREVMRAYYGISMPAFSGVKETHRRFVEIRPNRAERLTENLRTTKIASMNEILVQQRVFNDFRDILRETRPFTLESVFRFYLAHNLSNEASLDLIPQDYKRQRAYDVTSLQIHEILDQAPSVSREQLQSDLCKAFDLAIEKGWVPNHMRNPVQC